MIVKELSGRAVLAAYHDYTTPGIYFLKVIMPSIPLPPQPPQTLPLPYGGHDPHHISNVEHEGRDSFCARNGSLLAACAPITHLARLIKTPHCSVRVRQCTKTFSRCGRVAANAKASRSLSGWYGCAESPIKNTTPKYPHDRCVLPYSPPLPPRLDDGEASKRHRHSRIIDQWE
jgi:hypothetical protein